MNPSRSDLNTKLVVLHSCLSNGGLKNLSQQWVSPSNSTTFGYYSLPFESVYSICSSIGT